MSIHSIRPQFRKSLASTILKDIQYKKSNYYYFLGKLEEWNSSEIPDLIPTTYEHDTATRNNVVYCKKILPNDVTLVIPRFDWVSTTTYTQWDDTLEMKGTNFYVVTDENKVYKCLSNNSNNIAPSISLIKPTGNSLDPIVLADGYIWKYMYEIPNFKVNRFSTTNYIPVQKAMTDSFYNNGSIDSVSVLESGSGYVDLAETTLSVSGIGTGAILIPKISRSTGSIVDVYIEDAGTGYNNSTTISINVPLGTVVDGLYSGNSSAILEAVVDAGSIKRVLVRDPGVGYPYDTSTVIQVTGDGSGTVLSPVIDTSGAIVDVVVDEVGSGYTNMEITAIGSGSGAILYPVYAASEIISDQSIVEQNCVAGAIYSIKMTNAGTGYTNMTTVQIVGDGNGAVATATVLDGMITKITMNVGQYGQNYTYASIIITDSTRSDLMGYENAAAYAIFPPYKGHGFDAVAELYCDTIGMVSSLRTDNLLTRYSQDFRQFGLIHQPSNIGTDKISTADYDFNVFEVVLNNTIGMIVDEILMIGTYVYRVVYFEGNTVHLQQMNSNYHIPSGTLTATDNSGRTYIVSSVLSNPILNKYSGDLLYISNEPPFVFSNVQGITVKTFIRF